MDLLDTPAEIMRACLCARSGSIFKIADTPGVRVPMFAASTPADPDDLATIKDTTGISHARLLASGRNVTSYGLQITSRSRNYHDAYTRLSAEESFLDGLRWAVVSVGANSYVIDTIFRSSPIVSLGHDELRRASCVMNVLMMLLTAP